MSNSVFVFMKCVFPILLLVVIVFSGCITLPSSTGGPECGTLECDEECYSNNDCEPTQECISGKCVDKIIINEPPTATINTPVEGSEFEVGDTISFSGSVTDSDSSSVKISWYIDRMGDGLEGALIKETTQAPDSVSGSVVMTGTKVSTAGQTISLEDEGATYNAVLIVDDGVNAPVEKRREFKLNIDEPIADSIATKNMKWENILTSTATYTNPYKDVIVEVEYTSPNGEKFDTYAFWDGGNEFKIRMAFPYSGIWSWKTTSSDTSNSGLHNKEGTVSVSEYTGNNKLYKKGFLKVSSNKRYLTYADGTPFFWLGDTAWVAPLGATYEDWKTYIDDRVAKKFSVIQISPASWWGGTQDRYGNTAFLGNGDLTSDKWNPNYWKEYDRKVQYANEKGLVIVVVGLMEPVERYPSESNAVLFGRNFVSRFYGNLVIFSPSFDTWDSNYFEQADEVGNEIDIATSRHLITQHPGTPYHPLTNTIVDYYFGKSYMDFIGMQTGHNSGNRDWCVWKAINWNIDAYRKTPTKPLINMEAYYDSGDTYKGDDAAYLGNELDARSLGYLSMLSGAKGYTYGAYGIWDWESDSSKPWYWNNARQYSSSTHMTYLYNFFNSIKWYDLEPSPDSIKNQPTEKSKLMGFAKTADGTLGVGYLHKTNSIKLDMSVFSKTINAKWYNPRDGTYTDISETFSNSGEQTFNRPDDNDWVLYLY